MEECKECIDFKCRCQDCVCLVEQDGEWFCDEQNDFCKNVKECNEWG